MLKIVTVAIMMHTEKAIGEVPSDVACPVFKGRNMRIEGTVLWLDQQKTTSECAYLFESKTAISIIICALV